MLCLVASFSPAVTLGVNSFIEKHQKEHSWTSLLGPDFSHPLGRGVFSQCLPTCLRACLCVTAEIAPMYRVSPKCWVRVSGLHVKDTPNSERTLNRFPPLSSKCTKCELYSQYPLTALHHNWLMQREMEDPEKLKIDEMWNDITFWLRFFFYLLFSAQTPWWLFFTLRAFLRSDHRSSLTKMYAGSLPYHNKCELS